MITMMGEESVTDEATALLELVKNAYDADATDVQVYLSGLQNTKMLQVIIRDNGCGMSQEVIEKKWLSPAYSSKKRQKQERKRTKLGRLPIGEKGVGRFAVQKLGSTLELITRSEEAPEIVVQIDWDEFNREDIYLDEVEFDLNVREPEIFTGTQTGTVLIVKQGQTAWTEKQVKKLQKALKRLQSPFKEGNLKDFDITLRCPEFPGYEDIDRSDILDHTHYMLAGTIEEDGKLYYDYTCMLPGIPGRKNHNQERSLVGGARDELSGERPSCGRFYVNFYVWDRTQDYLDKSKVTRTELDEMAGVSLFRDGLRVLPYGEAGNDWLELDRVRVNDPSGRFGHNNIIGFISIDQEDTPDLRDKTNREGLIDNDAFKDLRALARAAVNVMVDEWRQDRPPKPGKVVRAPAATRSASEAVQKAQEKVQQMTAANGSAGGTMEKKEEAADSGISGVKVPTENVQADVGKPVVEGRVHVTVGLAPKKQEDPVQPEKAEVEEISLATLAVYEEPRDGAWIEPVEGKGKTDSDIAPDEPVGNNAVLDGPVAEEKRRMEKQSLSLERQLKQRDELLEVLRLLEEAAEHQQWADDIRDEEHQRLLELAATGMAAERVVHEFGRQVQAVGDLIQELRAASRGQERLQTKVEAVAACLTGLRNEFRGLAPYAASYRMERTRLVSIDEPIQTAALVNRSARETAGVLLEISGEPFEVAGRPAALVQILDNLFHNACFWLSGQSIRKRVLRVRMDEQARTVCVEDTGPGVASTLAKQIFQPWVSGRNGGRGLGLYIVRELITDIQGTIALDTEYSEGARFILTFPGSIKDMKPQEEHKQ